MTGWTPPPDYMPPGAGKPERRTYYAPKRKRFGRAMHRAIRRHRTRLMLQRLKFVSADDPNYVHRDGYAYEKVALTPEMEDALQYIRNGLMGLPPP